MMMVVVAFVLMLMMKNTTPLLLLSAIPESLVGHFVVVDGRLVIINAHKNCITAKTTTNKSRPCLPCYTNAGRRKYFSIIIRFIWRLTRLKMNVQRHIFILDSTIICVCNILLLYLRIILLAFYFGPDYRIVIVMIDCLWFNGSCMEVGSC